MVKTKLFVGFLGIGILCIVLLTWGIFRTPAKKLETSSNVTSNYFICSYPKAKALKIIKVDNNFGVIHVQELRPDNSTESFPLQPGVSSYLYDATKGVFLPCETVNSNQDSLTIDIADDQNENMRVNIKIHMKHHIISFKGTISPYCWEKIKW